MHQWIPSLWWIGEWGWMCHRSTKECMSIRQRWDKGSPETQSWGWVNALRLLPWVNTNWSFLGAVYAMHSRIGAWAKTVSAFLPFMELPFTWWHFRRSWWKTGFICVAGRRRKGRLGQRTSCTHNEVGRLFRLWWKCQFYSCTLLAPITCNRPLRSGWCHARLAHRLTCQSRGHHRLPRYPNSPTPS